MKTMSEIAEEVGADKRPEEHDYCGTYERVVGHLRNKPCKILEVGVKRGAGMKMWLEAFPIAQIVGVDKNTSKCEARSERLTLLDGDATKAGTYQVAARYGLFDLVSEDSAHSYEASMACLNALPILVKPGGVMVIEDVQLGYSHPENKSMERFVNEAAKLAHGGGTLKTYPGRHWHMATPLAKEIASVEMCRGLVIVRRVG
tara:strand:+ start:35555 stop:36160 length:606 start_codon:yes stop_codon:yes gene_type:complete